MSRLVIASRVTFSRRSRLSTRPRKYVDLRSGGCSGFSSPHARHFRNSAECKTLGGHIVVGRFLVAIISTGLLCYWLCHQIVFKMYSNDPQSLPFESKAEFDLNSVLVGMKTCLYVMTAKAWKNDSWHFQMWNNLFTIVLMGRVHLYSSGEWIVWSDCKHRKIYFTTSFIPLFGHSWQLSLSESSDSDINSWMQNGNDSCLLEVMPHTLSSQIVVIVFFLTAVNW